MPNNKSAEKRVRQNEKKYQRNKTIKTQLKTYEKNLRTEIEDKQKDSAETLLNSFTSAMDKATGKGVIEKNKASRKKSQLTKLFTVAFSS